MNNSKQQTPPTWPLRLLKYVLREDYLEEIEGDLEELYKNNLEKHSTVKSNWLYTLEVIKILRPLLLKSMDGTYKMNSYGILKNYFKVTIRNIKANKIQNAIKITGIAVALAASITIYQYISFERSFDNFHPDLDQLYRVDVDRIHGGVIQSQKSTSYSAFGPDAEQDIPGIEEFARVRIRNSSIVVNKDSVPTTYSIKKPAFVDPTFLTMFDFSLNNASVLEDPKSIILTESTSKKYFGDSNPVGQIITFIHGRYELALEVQAIIPDVPSNSHIQFEALVPYQAIFPENDWVSHSWDWSGVTTYLKLKSDVNPAELASAFPALVRKYKGEKMKERDMDYQFSLRPVKNIHLQSHLDGEFEVNGNEQSLYFLGISAFLIIVISWLNNITLSSAHNMTRVKEMSVRRVLGAHRGQVFTQLFVEALFIHIVAIILAFGLIISAKDMIEPWLDISLNMDILFQPGFFGIVMLYIILGSTLVSFDYNLLFNSFKQNNLFKKAELKTSLSFRKLGVILQFSILAGLIILTWAVHSQLTYIQNYNLGLDQENVLIIEKPRLARAENTNSPSAVFQNKLQSLPCVSSYTSSFQIPGSELGWTGGIRQTTQPKEYGQDLYVSTVSDYYIKTLGLEVIAGKSFENINCDEHRHVILNRTATKLLGYENPADAVLTDLINSIDRKQKVVGVAEDFHFSSLRDHIEPMMLAHLPRPLDYIFVRMEKGNLYNNIEQIETSWKEAYPNVPFEFSFMDDQINLQYKADVEFKKLFSAFSGIATMLALMGILGLSSFYASRRTKEIGIRKVLGASIPSIIWLLSSRFVLLIAIGSAIAIPISYYFISTWLQNFAYQVNIEWIWFIGTSFLVLSISWIILGLQTVRAANVNPSECLRNE